MFGVAVSCGHCDDKVWGCTGLWAQNPKATGHKSKLAYEDCRGWYRWLVEEGGKEC
jgi:hypothetical protein